MGIARNAVGGGNRISEAGEYAVKVTEMKTGNSKAGKPMLTITFEDKNGKQIAGYFVKTLSFHMVALANLKEAAGLKKTDNADKLHGREVGILVEAEAPDESGRRFMQIAGYGPMGEVGGVPSSDFAEQSDTDSIPF